jgi:hypothetical protein
MRKRRKKARKKEEKKPKKPTETTTANTTSKLSLIFPSWWHNPRLTQTIKEKTSGREKK